MPGLTQAGLCEQEGGRDFFEGREDRYQRGSADRDEPGRRRPRYSDQKSSALFPSRGSSSSSSAGSARSMRPSFVTRAVRQAVTTLAGPTYAVRRTWNRRAAAAGPGGGRGFRRSARSCRGRGTSIRRPANWRIVTQATTSTSAFAAQSRGLRDELQQRLDAIEVASSNWQHAWWTGGKVVSPLASRRGFRG